MTKPKAGREKVYTVEKSSILDKRFNRLHRDSPRLGTGYIHPLIVLADLRNGSLGSLDRYLKQEKGLPDREIAVELRKLLSGSAERTSYRIVVTDHPNALEASGGRPQGISQRTCERYRHIAAKYEAALVYREGKAYLAREDVYKDEECNETTVKRAIDWVRNDDQRALRRQSEEAASQQRAAELLKRRNDALKALRKAKTAKD